MGNDKEVMLNQEFTQHLQDINVQMNDIIKTSKHFLNEVDKAKSEISKIVKDEVSKSKEEIPHSIGFSGNVLSHSRLP
jgi:hypothetical protein